MPAISNRELQRLIHHEGAPTVAQHLAESIANGDINYKDMPGIRNLFDALVTDKKDGKTSAGHDVLSGRVLSEEAASYVSMDAFDVVTSQIYFNALTTYYNAADFTLAPLFRKIPSTLFRGEKFAGISNLGTILEPVGEGQELPSLLPTQDYSESPAQQHRGAIVNLTFEMVKGDRTGEVMDMFEKLGTALGISKELEAAATLADLEPSGVTANAAYTRTHYNWKKTAYGTYNTAISLPTAPWANSATGAALVDYNSLSSAWTLIANTLDPFTGLPIVEPPGRWKLIVTPTNKFLAERIKRTVQFMTSPAVTDYSPQTWTEGGFNVDFDVVVSKYLNYIAGNGSNTLSTGVWFFGIPSAAFSWQEALDVTMAQALPNTGDMFKKSLAGQYKAEMWLSSFVFNPRFITKQTP